MTGDDRDAGQVGGVDGGHRWGVDRGVGAGRGLTPRRFDVRRVLAARAPHELVLADVGDGHELVAGVPADLAGLGFDGAPLEVAAGEDPRVRVVHALVGAFEVVDVGVERVRVLHEELAGSEQPEAGPQLVAVLPVDLIERDGQVAIARVLPGHEGGDGLLGGRGEAELGVLAVVEPEHQRPVRLVPSGAGPQLEGLDDREGHLLGVDGVHLVAHDLLDLRQHPTSEGQPGVDAAGDPADAAGPEEQPVTLGLGVGGVVAQGPQEQLRHAHWRRLLAGRPRNPTNPGLSAPTGFPDLPAGISGGIPLQSES